MGSSPVGLIGGSTLVVGALDGASFDTIASMMTFAARAILAMLSSTMLPEAAREGGPVVGLVTAAGFLAAVLLDRL